MLRAGDPGTLYWAHWQTHTDYISSCCKRKAGLSPATVLSHRVVSCVLKGRQVANLYGMSAKPPARRDDISNVPYAKWG